MSHSYSKQIKSNSRKDGIITGLFFITASLTAIIGLVLYGPLLNTSNYLEQGHLHSAKIATGAIFELILACANIGTAVMMFPYLKRYDIRFGIAYLVFRFFEAIVIVIGVISMLSLLSLSQSYSMGTKEITEYKAAGVALKALHDWTFILGPHFLLGINTAFYSYVLYKTQLVPKNLAVMGLLGAAFIFIAAILEIYGLIKVNSLPLVLMALTIAVYEMILAAWLIVKGFRVSL